MCTALRKGTKNLHINFSIFKLLYKAIFFWICTPYAQLSYTLNQIREIPSEESSYCMFILGELFKLTVKNNISLCYRVGIKNHVC